MNNSGDLRAGPYAEFEGIAYSARFKTPLHAMWADVRLFASGTGPRPSSFTMNPDGRWTRLVAPIDLTRLFRVDTTATWRGHAVTVDNVDDDVARVVCDSNAVAHFSEVSEGAGKYWVAEVAAFFLKDVSQTVHELPLPGHPSP